MNANIYKIVEITGSSTEGQDQAVRNAIEEAGKELRHLRWFHVIDSRGHIEDGKVAHWQVTVKIGFNKEPV